MTQTAKNIL